MKVKGGQAGRRGPLAPWLLHRPLSPPLWYLGSLVALCLSVRPSVWHRGSGRRLGGSSRLLSGPFLAQSRGGGGCSPPSAWRDLCLKVSCPEPRASGRAVLEVRTGGHGTGVTPA